MFRHLKRGIFLRPRNNRRLYSLDPPLTPQQGRLALRVARQAIINNEHNFLARQRLRIRLLFMGQIRPMKIDDVMALVSWTIVGHIGFVLAGTTTAVSIMLFFVNSFSFEEFIAEKVCEKLTALTGYNIFFESAIVPRWRDGTIRLQNVGVVCNGDTWMKLKKQEAEKEGKEFDSKKVGIRIEIM
jgi:distribution and morphology protein 31